MGAVEQFEQAGERPWAAIRATASPAAPVEPKTATRVSDAAGAGRSATVTSVITPRVPSEPTKSRVRSYPATPLAVRRPVRSTSPEASTTSSPSTYSVVTPYLTQHIPPALVATLPPMVDDSHEPGSGGYQSPCSATAAVSAALTTPGCTTAIRLTGSISRMASIAVVLSTTAPSTAFAAPASPVRAPCGTTGTP